MKVSSSRGISRAAVVVWRPRPDRSYPQPAGRVLEEGVQSRPLGRNPARIEDEIGTAYSTGYVRTEFADYLGNDG